MIKKAFVLPALVAGLLISCNTSEEKKNEESTTPVTDTTSVVEEAPITDPKETEVWEPEPAVVTFNENGVPSDAIILFNGENLNAWKSATDSIVNAPWQINKDGSMTVVGGTGDIQTKESFGDMQLHVEWQAPQVVEGEGQDRGNSGIFLQGLYEVQVLNSFENRTYSNGQATAIYKQSIPLANATKPTKEWQSYDIIYHQPVFDTDGNKTKSATVTLLHNGVLVHDNVEIKGTTEYIGNPKNEAHGEGPIKLQDHGNPVSFRNIWLRKL
ncbi:DUF1080 domain-containing protein [Leeuwenhoekiella sp. LLG6367-2.1]|uniref:3-keto-disaccharide hydrolase n=1 Tax=Leeuwenhoekiella sp. LLG6367-2.1 TaxID=3160833 RepID=UPI00386E3969